MKGLVIMVATLGLLDAACTGGERGPVAGLAGPQFAHVQDLDGVPNLIVDGKRLADSWVVYDETFDPRVCSVIEGDVQPGDHRVLRFTVTTPNIGTADVFVGNPLDHVAAKDSLFEFATCHNHFHFRHYATYRLLSLDRTKVWRAAKRGFCMLDITPWNNNDGGVTAWVYRSCGTRTLPGYQGISVGYADTYNKHLGGQYFVLDGGDGQDPIPPGDYIIQIVVNPPFVAAAGEPCPHVDLDGLCHQLLESDYTDNIAEVRITIPDRTGKTGFGPGADNQAGTEILDDENRPDKP